MSDGQTPATQDALLERVAELERALAAERSALAVERAARSAEQSRADEAIAERDRLREAYRHLQLEVELARRRLVVAKAERVDTAQLQIEFASKLAALDALSGQLAPTQDGDEPSMGKPGRGKPKSRPTGRRNLRELDLPEERIEIADPALEKVRRRAWVPRTAAS